MVIFQRESIVYLISFTFWDASILNTYTKVWGPGYKMVIFQRESIGYFNSFTFWDASILNTYTKVWGPGYKISTFQRKRTVNFSSLTYWHEVQDTRWYYCRAKEELALEVWGVWTLIDTILIAHVLLFSGAASHISKEKNSSLFKLAVWHIGMGSRIQGGIIAEQKKS